VVQNFVAETPERTAIIAGDFFSKVYHVFKLPQHILGDHKFTADHGV
jgi:hypothetical protein